MSRLNPMMILVHAGGCDLTDSQQEHGPMSESHWQVALHHILVAAGFIHGSLEDQHQLVMDLRLSNALFVKDAWTKWHAVRQMTSGLFICVAASCQDAKMPENREIRAGAHHGSVWLSAVTVCRVRFDPAVRSANEDVPQCAFLSRRLPLQQPRTNLLQPFLVPCPP